MSVSTDICNSALVKLGAERINNLNEDNKRARLCLEQYGKIKNRVLRSHNWTCAIKRASLPKLNTTLAFGEENLFQKPMDCLRIVSTTVDAPYKLEGDKLLSFEEVLEISYISSNTPEELFDVCLREVMACALAADLCYVINQSSNMKAQLLQEYEFWIGEARSFNSQEITPDNYLFDTWSDSRLFGGRANSRRPDSYGGDW
jgi:hypothetical protein